MRRGLFFLLVLLLGVWLYRSCSSAEQWTEEGIATYYHPDLEGRATASGEPYKQAAYTAAHKTLPFGTVVEVCRTDSAADKWGCVQVRINDRGPFVEGRIIDLAEAPARELGLLKDGSVPVRIIVVSSPGELSASG